MMRVLEIDLRKRDDKLRLTIQDIKGSYQLPYIQSSAAIRFVLSGFLSNTQKIKIEE